MDDDGPIARHLPDDGDGPIATLTGDADPERGPDEDAESYPAGPDQEPLEPESVSPEHAAFVLVGAALTLLVIVNAL